MYRIAFTLSALLLLSPFTAVGADPSPEEFFREKIEPILATHCLECHASDRKGGLDLTHKDAVMKGGESGTVLTPGNPDESLLLDYVSSEAMPPDEPLSSAEIETIRQWIQQGAFYPDTPLDPFAISTASRAGYDWWSLKPLSSVDPSPSAKLPSSWSDNPVDRFVFAKLADMGLQPSPPADKRSLIRRVTFDLTGLPPSYEEVEAFVNDNDPRAYQRLIDRLLASPQYGEHWGRHWLDVVRFGESRGFERNEIINNAWPFRDYVIRSLNEDKPFDRFIIEHLAGDMVADNDPGIEVGTTFLVAGPYDDVGNQDAAQAAQIRANTLDDMIRTTGEAFLGLTVGCGRCHNHKFDPVTQADYYSMYATFAGVQHGNRVVASKQQRQEHTERITPLNKKKAELDKQKADLQKEIQTQAESNAKQLEKHWVRPAINRQTTEDKFPETRAKFIRLIATALDTNPQAATGYNIDEFEVWTVDEPSRNVALATAGAQARGQSRVAEDFAGAYSPELTIDGQFGARWIAASPELTIELSQPERIDRVVFSSDRTGDAGDHHIARFVGEYRVEASLDGKQWQKVASSADRKPASDALRRKRLVDQTISSEQQQELRRLNKELSQVRQQLASIPPLESWWVGTFRQEKGPFHVFVGGNPQRKGEKVTSSALSALSRVATSYDLPDDVAEGERRLALAKWIVAPDNPLTPRVLANRVWHYHFGVGIVDTPSDFGFMGGRPTHPALLDWLASQLVKNGWRLKPLHKQIMFSQTYRQSSGFQIAAAQVDADSRHLWRFPPRRLSAEEIRDTMLFVAGVLDPKAGGPGFRLYRYLQDNVATYVPLDRFGPETYRRAVYHQNARATRVDLMTEFDCPDNAFAAPRRTSTTTPLQALTMMNHSFTQDMAERFAECVESEVEGVVDAHYVRKAFERALLRQPNDIERQTAEELVRIHGLRALCRALLNCNELIYVD